MKTPNHPTVQTVLVTLILSIFVSCTSASNGTSNEDQSVGGTSITSNDDAIQNIPSPDPSSMDYSLASSEANQSVSRGLSRQEAPGPEEVGCLVDTLYTTGTRFARQIERMMLCKARGAFALASEGSVTLTLEDSGEVYLRFLSMRADSDDPGEDESDENVSRQSDDSDDTLIAKIKHTPGEGLGTYQLFVCEEETQIGYATFTVTDDTYTGRAILRRAGEDECAQAVYTRNTTSITSEDFEGNVTLNFDHETEQGILALAADGATQSNTLQGKRSAAEGTGVALGYWEATHGCGNGKHNDETTGDVAFSISASSDGSKTYSNYDGDSAAVCANLPSEPSIADCPEFSEVAGAAWDCDLTGKTVVEFSSAADLEDVGGDRCRELSDSFEEDERNPDDCFSGPE